MPGVAKNTFVFLHFTLFPVYFWLRWVFTAAQAFLHLHGQAGPLWLMVRASRCNDLLQSLGSRHVGVSRRGTWAVVGVQGSKKHSLNSCSAQNCLLSEVCGVFPDQGSNPMSPALPGGFFAPEPPEKLYTVFLQ